MMRIDIGGLHLNYETRGQGPNIVMIHGAGGNLSYWEPQVEALSPSFRVITYDQRGYGDSDSASSYHFNDLVEDLRRLLATLRIEHTFLMGFSQGGAVALLFTATYPDVVDGLIVSNASVDNLLSPQSPELLKAQKQNAEAMIAAIRSGGIVAFADMFMGLNFSPGLKERNPDIWNRYHRMLLQARPDTLINTVLTPGATQVAADLSKIRCPVLFVQGEYDPLVPPEKRERAQKAIAGSKMVVLPAGHATAAEMPHAFNEVVRSFLEEIQRGKE